MATQLDPEGVEIANLRTMTGGFTGKRVLEVGCGSGRLTWRYAHEADYVLGLDHSSDEIAKANQALPESLRSRVEFKPISILDFHPMSHTRFNVAILSWSL